MVRGRGIQKRNKIGKAIRGVCLSVRTGRGWKLGSKGSVVGKKGSREPNGNHRLTYGLAHPSAQCPIGEFFHPLAGFSPLGGLHHTHCPEGGHCV